MTLTVGSLFSGIGGLDLGLERAGMRVIWQSEIDPYACRVLAKHWPHVPNLGDITTIDWSTVERPDVICGGYPCQPFSLAGVRRGEHDPRHLWPHFLAAVRSLRPRFALMENVTGHLSLGLGRVLGDLAESGYDASWDCIPAAAVGAPHRRDRVFIVAHADSIDVRDEPVAVTGRSSEAVAGIDGAARDVADPCGKRWDGRSRQQGAGREATERLEAIDHTCDSGGSLADAESVAIGSGLRSSGSPRIRWRRPGYRSGTGECWATEPDVGRVAHGVPARMDRLRALGNAVVPQVAEHVGRLIVEAAA